ncbi:iron ABC transporter permease [Microbacterium sp. LRZ72]|uniref:ABC transporter permease n=1 Tax=Microbacterium sp. LRZ72 TaxID=2942481 RepID=UPI0029AEA91F|nr:iron ABC transporter permease [Microbacterium sp. LRZ72]MDX2376368.1 iron ABC transporter permease [Microbacterium sp. LRZ72]
MVPRARARPRRRDRRGQGGRRRGRRAQGRAVRRAAPARAVNSVRAAFLNPQLSAVIVCAICFIAPAVMVIQGAFRTSAFGESEWTTSAVTGVLTRPRTWEVVWTTVAMGVTTVVISTLLAATFAAIYTRTNTPLRRLILVIMGLVVATPGLFFAISWGLLGNPRIGLINEGLATLFGEGGRVIDMESWWGVVFASALRLVALQFFLLLGPFLAMDNSLDEAAQMSGASPTRAFFQIQLPVLLPAISGVMILAFILFLEAFDVAQVLGVPAGIYVIPTEIYAYLSQSTGPQYGEASTVSMMLMVVLLILVLVQIKVLGRRSFTTVGGKEARGLLRDVGGWKWLFTGLIVAFTLLAVVLPLVQLVVVSLSPFLGSQGVYNFDNYAQIFASDQMLEAYGNTALIAFFGGLLAVTASMILNWAARFRRGPLARVIEFSQWIGLAMPGLVLALGVLWLFLALPFLHGFYATPVILMFALFIITIPIASRATGGAMAQIPRSLEEAAWTSGASKAQALFMIIGRLILPSFISGWILCFVIISGTLSAPLLLSGPRATFLSVEVFELYSEGQAPVAAAAFVLLILGFVVLYGIAVLVRRLAAGPRARTPRASSAAPPSADTSATKAIATGSRRG